MFTVLIAVNILSKQTMGKQGVKEKKNRTVWVVTSEYNDYDQHGDYFVAVFLGKPTFQELKGVLGLDDVTTGKLTRGGGRQNTEHVWYNLREVEVGLNCEE